MQPHVEVKIIDEAGNTAPVGEQGELLTRGYSVMKGYWNDDERTAESVDAQGWMYTGDLGAIDDEGFISITGRKKDLIITAGGKNVAPAEMEGYLQAIPGVGQAVVVGDRQPYLAALIVLDPEALPALEEASGISGLDLCSRPTFGQGPPGCRQQLHRTPTPKSPR